MSRPKKQHEVIEEEAIAEPTEENITENVIDDDLDVEVDDGIELEATQQEELISEDDIDSLLLRRPQGRPKGTLDYKLPVHQIEGEYRKSEMVAAFVHLYYMLDRQFAPDNVPLHHFQKLLNISRHTVYRCLDDVKNGKILALKLHAELMVMSENLAQAEVIRKRRQRQKMAESQARIMQRRILERRLGKEAKSKSETQAPPVPKKPAKRRDMGLSE